MLTTPSKVSPRGAIARGWAEVSKDISQAVVATGLTFFFAILIGLLLQQVFPTITGVFIAIEIGLFRTGLTYFFIRRARGEAEYKDIFAGFTRFLRPAALASAFIVGISFQWLALMMANLWMTIGVIVLTVVVEAVYLFTPVVIAAGESAWWWGALDASKRATLPRLNEYLLVVLALIALNAGGLLCAVVGLLVTVPVTICVIIALFQDARAAQPPAV
ncbi:MAG: hypothetical protein ACREJQ_06740 [bacterium]